MSTILTDVLLSRKQGTKRQICCPRSYLSLRDWSASLRIVWIRAVCWWKVPDHPVLDEHNASHSLSSLKLEQSAAFLRVDSCAYRSCDSQLLAPRPQRLKHPLRQLVLPGESQVNKLVPGIVRCLWGRTIFSCSEPDAIVLYHVFQAHL